MNDILTRIQATHREIGSAPFAGGEGRSLLVRRGYDAAIEDVWNACTDGERLARWLGPVSGDLRLGGRFQLEGNAGGEILECDEPRRLKVTWAFGPGMDTEVVVRLSPSDGGGTILELEHASPAAMVDAMVEQYGPGGTLGMGAGWDLTLLALDRHLAGEPFDVATWESEPDAREFAIEATRAWAPAAQATWGTSDADLEAALAFAASQFEG